MGTYYIHKTKRARNVQKRQLQGDLIVDFQYLKGLIKEKSSTSYWTDSDKTRVMVLN